MFMLTENAKPRFAILLPVLAAFLLLVFAITGQAQTKVVSQDTSVDATLFQLMKLKLNQANLVYEANKFNVEEVQPALDKAIAADTVLKQKQQTLIEVMEEVKTLQKKFEDAKKSLESETGCILKEDVIGLDCTQKDK